MMEQVFSMTTFWTWHSRHSGKLRVGRHVRNGPHSMQDQWNNSVSLPTTVQYLGCYTVEWWDAATSHRPAEGMPPMKVNFIFRKEVEMYIRGTL